MSSEKYSNAINLIGDKYGLPDFAYQEEIVNDDEKEKTRSIILGLKDKISACVRLSPNKNNVMIPFYEAITAALPHEKASDMTVANRLFSAISVSAIINIDNRPRYLLRKEGDHIMQTIPFATFDDLSESMLFVEDADGLRHYIREWYFDVFLECFNSKKEPDSKIDCKGRTITEKIVAVTTEELVDKTYEKQLKKFTKQQILENYVYPLSNHGYIDKADSDIDRRCKIYYPVIPIKNNKLFDSEQTNNFSQEICIPVRNTTLFPNKEYLISRIQHILKYSSGKECYVVKKIVSPDNQEISIESLVERYYPTPQAYFQSTEVASVDIPAEYIPKGKIASESQENPRVNIEFSELMLKRREELFDRPKSNKLLYSCYYCTKFETEDKQEYERHGVMHHPGRPAYPAAIDLQKHGLSPKGYEWEL
jgi:hypothetical protein